MPIVVESITETTVRDFFWPRSSVENPQGCRELGDVAILTHRRGRAIRCTPAEAARQC